MEFVFLGEALWLDFVNTARAATSGPTDRLVDAAAYDRWTRAGRLRSDADRVPFGEVLAFRDRLDALARALSAGRQPPASAIEAINRILAQTRGWHQLTRVGGAWRMIFAVAEPPFALDAIARSAATTLADPRVLVRECAAPSCTLVFADDSPNHGRRWCRYATCGKQARVERRRTPR
ncbi:MAG TPA: CGNR zinc finger domain-containing protein [Gemmatimonadales bacterium]|nr:CGNR zinc finger domain-containing protein [Gemmatimonadales bacterium]